jgi:hypothetical protein
METETRNFPMSKKVLMAVAVLGACVAFTGCGSDDDDDSGSGSGSGSGLGGLLGKLGGEGSGTGTAGGGDTGGGDTGGGDTGGGDTGGGDTGGGDISGGGDVSGGGIGCEAACTLIVTCLNSACATDFTVGDCTPECAGVESGIPLSVESSCEDVATALEIGSFQAVCSEVDDGGGDDTGGGDTGGGSGAGASADTCCNVARCASGCADQNCVIACAQQYCGADGSACAACENWSEAEAQACFGGQLPG